MSEKLHKGWLRLRNGEKFSPNVLSTSILTQENEHFDEIVALKSDLVQSDWNESDETLLSYIKNKPEIATDDEILDMLIEMNVVTPLTLNNKIITNPEGKIYSL